MLHAQLRTGGLGEVIEQLAHLPPTQAVVDDQRTGDNVENGIGQSIAHRRQRSLEADQTRIAREAGEVGAQHRRPGARQTRHCFGDRQASSDRIAQLFNCFDQGVLDGRPAAIVPSDVIGKRRQQAEPTGQRADHPPAQEQLREQGHEPA